MLPLLPLESVSHSPTLLQCPSLIDSLITQDSTRISSILPSNIVLATNEVTSSLAEHPPLPSSSIGGGIFGSLLGGLDYSEHPLVTVLASYCIVTASDMVPFVPCQPIAIAMGAKLGFSVAFPVALFGQSTAGVLAFTGARKAANSAAAQSVASSKLSEEALDKLDELRKLTDAEKQGDGRILLALIGLRLAPFFPFSAGNYLLGSTTSVPLRLFIIATILGCFASNLLSVSVGAGGAMFFLPKT